jgi:hypothetical protein
VSARLLKAALAVVRSRSYAALTLAFRNQALVPRWMTLVPTMARQVFARVSSNSSYTESSRACGVVWEGTIAAASKMRRGCRGRRACDRAWGSMDRQVAGSDRWSHASRGRDGAGGGGAVVQVSTMETVMGQWSEVSAVTWPVVVDMLSTRSRSDARTRSMMDVEAGLQAEAGAKRVGWSGRLTMT